MNIMNTYVLIIVLIIVIIIDNILLQKKIENFQFDYDNLPQYEQEQNNSLVRYNTDINNNSNSINKAIIESNNARIISSNALTAVRDINTQFADTLVSVNNKINNSSGLQNIIKYGDSIRIKHIQGPTFLNKRNSRFTHKNYYPAYTYFIIVGKQIGTPVKYKDVVYLRSTVGSHRVLQNSSNNRYGRFSNNNLENWEKMRFISKENINSTNFIKNNEQLYIQSLKSGGDGNRYLQLWGGNRYFRDQKFDNRNISRHNYWKTLQIIS